jgi:hypothetical protein
MSVISKTGHAPIFFERGVMRFSLLIVTSPIVVPYLFAPLFGFPPDECVDRLRSFLRIGPEDVCITTRFLQIIVRLAANLRCLTVKYLVRVHTS